MQASICTESFRRKELFTDQVLRVAEVPHCVAEEDTYAGYRIPKGAVILPNT